MTDKLERLGMLDRATLTVWRVANTVGWWIACVFVAEAIRLADRGSFERLADHNVFPSGFAAAALHLPFALATAFAVGGIAGSRIWRDQARVALITLVLVFVGSTVNKPLSHALPAAIAIPVGYLWARHLASHRRG